MKGLWMRLGISLELTDEEVDVILSRGTTLGAARDAVLTAIKEGRWEMDGESYVPGECIHHFNRVYGTNYKEEDSEVWF